ncbi:MAG: c-type cytochrome [Chitinophagaceae bacterium]|nr:c-type cytochrome [Chitinophagaceae bacterium]MCB9047257.1 c-type cytochrome [Chitinophagales bacterium]
MKKFLFYIACFVTSMVVVVACQHKYDGPLPATADTSASSNSGNNGTDTGICFTRDILPIFVSNCAKAGCHDAATRSEGYQLTDYASIVSKKFVAGNANATEIYEKITEDNTKDIMPPPPASPLTQEQRNLIKRWIDEGGKNTTNCSVPCDTNNFKFTADIQPMINKYCTGCHSGSGASGGILLDNYVNITAANKDGSLLGSIKHEFGFKPMPDGGGMLSDCEIKQVEKWVNDGMLNN